jgi:uncharacterized protein (TIRG00374 family)
MTARTRGLGAVGQWSGLLISAVLLVLILRKAQNLTAAFQAVQAADLRWLLFGALVYLVGFLPRGLRWGRLLAGVRRIPLVHLTAVEAVGFMANNVLPFRLGELVRAYTIGRKAEISVTSALATIVMERLCDGLTLVLGLAAISLVYPFPDWVKRAGLAAALLFFGATAFLALLAYQRRTARRLVAFLSRPFPEALRRLIADLLDRFDSGLHLLRSPLDAALVAVLSVVVWAIELGVYLCVLAAFAEPIRGVLGHAIPLHDAFLLMILVNFGSIVPSGPAYIGTFQAVAIAVLTGISGLNAPVAFSIAWVLWATMVVPIVIVGFACLSGEHLQLRTMVGLGSRRPGGRAPSVDWKPNRHAGPGGSG